jgi:ribose 5-phosphate isomerase B
VLPAALSVAKGECDRGIFVDGVGYGSAMIANKVRGIFACVCQDPVCAELARQHNDANVLCIGGKIIGPVLAMAIAKTWMATEPLTAAKYVRRRDKVAKIDEEHTQPLK